MNPCRPSYREYKTLVELTMKQKLFHNANEPWREFVFYMAGGEHKTFS